MLTDTGPRLFPLAGYKEPSDGYFEGLARAMIEPPESEEDGAFDNDSIPAGLTYFAQFLNHDIDFSTMANSAMRSTNLNLDSLYGAGPDTDPGLYSPDEYGAFVFGHTTNPAEDDLPRDASGVAVIGDLRNDENTMIGQLHLGFMKFHNAVRRHLVALEPELAKDARLLYVKTRRQVCWHYQWIIVEKLLPRIVSAAVLGEIRSGNELPTLRYYDVSWGPHVPVEFSVGAFRFGHSMARPAYNLNGHTSSGRGPIPLFVSNPTFKGSDLRGGGPLPAKWTVQWNLFLPFAGSTPQYSRRIDTYLARPLTILPGIPDGLLALRTLKHGVEMKLPSGQAIAKEIGMETVDIGGDDPLWYYILKEAEAMGGKTLGAVGSRIVAEVLIGLVLADPTSYMRAASNWEPTLPDRTGLVTGNFDLADLLAFAGVPMRFDQIPN